MMRYEYLSKYPKIFQQVTGLRIGEFDQLAQAVEVPFEEAERERLHKEKRQRASGGGMRSSLDRRDQVLLTVIWLRLYPQHSVLGYLFGVSQPTTGRYIERVSPVLAQAGRDTMRMPEPSRKQRKTLDELLQAIPELAVVVDTFEQRVQRPKNAADQNSWYSGKQRTHTVKSQVTVDKDSGKIVHIAPSVKGRTSDLTLVRSSTLLPQIPEGVGVLGDTGYQGIHKSYGLAFSPRKRTNGKRVLTEDDRRYNQAFAGVRIVVELTLNRMRRYQSLSQRDRNHRQHHTQRVFAIAGLVNRQLSARFPA